MKTLDLEALNVNELDFRGLITINGGFNQSAYNAGEKAGEFVRTCIDDLGRVITTYKLYKAFEDL